MCSLLTPRQQFQCLASFSSDFVTFPVRPNQCSVFGFFWDRRSLNCGTQILHLRAQTQDADFAARLSPASPRDQIVSEYHTATLAAELLLKANSVLTQSLNAGTRAATWPCSGRRRLGVTSLLQLRAAGLEQTAETTENHYFH